MFISFLLLYIYFLFLFFFLFRGVCIVVVGRGQIGFAHGGPSIAPPGPFSPLLNVRAAPQVKGMI